MKLSELVTTPKGRKATAKLAWDLSKITGKVAVAGAAGLGAALYGAAASNSSKPMHSESGKFYPDVTPDGYGYGPTGYGYYSGGVMVDED
ncbi:MAG: hypothetical protein HRU39_16300 [Salinicola sp.]|uniref:hypothetical protein n=1 Tax=Salinicola sp. TaxID=1978524 RepID=UPI001DDBD075|nr:hypothetical protein [Salinicola sp.]NRB57516.1 hypothetical protein [Salinicola sp.]